MWPSLDQTPVESLAAAVYHYSSYMDKPGQQPGFTCPAGVNIRPRWNISQVTAADVASGSLFWQGIEHNPELQGAVLLAQTHDDGWLLLQVLN